MPETAETLEQVIADVRGELPILRRRGSKQVADAIEEVIDRVAAAARDYLTFVSEQDAMMRSDRSQEWLRARYPQWERQGNARRNPHNPRERQYRLLIIPLSAQTEAARADARRRARAEVQR